MAKATHLGSKKPDDPIFRQGVTFSVPMSRQSLRKLIEQEEKNKPSKDKPESPDGEGD